MDFKGLRQSASSTFRRHPINVFGRRFSQPIALYLCLTISFGSQWCWGASRVFTLDPTRSSLTITGYVTSTLVTLSAEVSGSNTASYFGSVDSSLDATGITFGGGSSITANNFSGTGLIPDSTANYGIVAKELGITAAKATVVNLQFDATSAALPIGSDGKFTVTSAVTATATSGAFDYIQSLPTAGSGTDNVAGATAPDQSTSSGSLSLSGQTQTLTIPVKATILFSVSNPNDSAVTFTGQFVSTTTIPTPPIAYWTGNVNTNWNTVNQAATATNWATDATGATDADYFPGSTTDVFFTTSSHGANLNTTLAADFSIKGLTFTSAATSAATIGGTNKLTLGVDGITVQSGAASPVINAPVTLGSAQNWTINGANPLTVNGSLSTAGFALAKMGTGTLTLGGAPNLASNSALNVGAGTLILQDTGAPTIAGGVTASVASGATLQLAGTVSALANANGSNAANITTHGNGSASDGALTVVGATSQMVGTVIGDSSSINGGNGATATVYAGNTTVGDGAHAASLTARQILQNTLTINAGSTVTIAPTAGAGGGVVAAATTASAASTSNATSADGNSGSSSDPLMAIRDAIASGSISNAAGQRLENRVAAIEGLAATDPNLDVSLLESRVLAALPNSSIFPATDSPPWTGGDSGLLAVDRGAIGSGSSAAFAPAAGFNGSPAAVPEPSTLLLALLCGIGAVVLATRRRMNASQRKNADLGLS